MPELEFSEVEKVVIKKDQESEWKSLSRIGLFRVLLGIGVVLFIIVFTFFITNRVTKIPKNADAIVENCRNENKVIAATNEKFTRLDLLLDAFVERAESLDRPFPPEILETIEEFKKPIPLLDCKNLIEE